MARFSPSSKALIPSTLGGLLFLLLNGLELPVSAAPEPPVCPRSTQPAAPVQAPPTPSIRNRDDELVVRVEAPVDLKSLGIDPAPFQGVTNDSALIQIWATYKPRVIGRTKQTASPGILLELEDGRRFAAAHMGDHRTQAKDGTVALEAITQPGGFPIKNLETTQGRAASIGNVNEVWVIDASGKTERLSPANIDARHPEISPDGRYVAFTARYLVDGSLRDNQALMIKDRRTGELSSYTDRKHRFSEYQIAPLDWVEDGKVLRVIEDWGETGGHMKLKQVRFHPQ